MTEEAQENPNNLSLNYEKMHSASKLNIDTNHQLFQEKAVSLQIDEEHHQHNNQSYILQNTSVISNNSNNYNELFNNFDSVQKKIQELQEMAQGIISKEEDEDENMYNFGRVGYVNSNQARSGGGSHLRGSHEVEDEADMTINMSCLHPQPKAFEGMGDDTMINNVIDEVNQSLIKKQDNPNQGQFSQGLMNLEQQLHQIQNLKENNAFFKNKIVYINKCLMAATVDTRFLQDDSVKLQQYYSQDSVNQIIAKHRKELESSEKKENEIYSQLKDQIIINKQMEKKLEEKTEQLRVSKEKVGEKDQKILDLYNQLKEEIKANQQKDKLALEVKLNDSTHNSQIQLLNKQIKASYNQFDDLEHQFIEQVSNSKIEQDQIKNSPGVNPLELSDYLEKYKNLKEDTLTSLFQIVSINEDQPKEAQQIDMVQLVKLLRFYKQQNYLQKSQLKELIQATNNLYQSKSKIQKQ